MPIFENPQSISLSILRMRIMPLDPLARVTAYRVEYVGADGTLALVPYATVESSLTDAQILTLLGAAPTTAEQQLEADQIGAGNAFRALPQWATMNASEAEAIVQSGIWNGLTQAQVNAYIDTTLSGTTLATLKPQLITVLKQTASAILQIRTILAVLAKAVIYLRNLVLQ